MTKITNYRFKSPQDCLAQLKDSGQQLEIEDPGEGYMSFFRYRSFLSMMNFSS
jgi:hypothetical protein